MKKIQVIALSALIAMGVLLTSCEGGGVSTNVPLKTDADTLSYAFATKLYSDGLESHLMQMGIINDTVPMYYSYQRQIEADTTETGKAALQKEMRTKIDSIQKANDRNTAEFLKGMKSTINAPKSQNAYLVGQAIGHQIGAQMLPEMAKRVYGPESKKELNREAFMAAIASSIKKGEPAFPNPDMIFTMKMQELQEKERLAQEEEMKKQYASQIEAGEKFLAENKEKEGVVTLPSGLQYKVIKEGNGPKPAANDMVKVHYHGTLVDGKVFDSSVERNNPATFNVSGVIKGWTEALLLMPVGSKWMVYVPYGLGYGGQERGSIPPFSTLIFEVELLGIESK